jgi:phosphohistidine swiveling domain-containing protein
MRVTLQLAPARGVGGENIVGGKVVVELSEETAQLVGHGVLLVVADIDVDDLIAVEQIGQLAPYVRSLLEVVYELRIVRDGVEPR